MITKTNNFSSKIEYINSLTTSLAIVGIRNDEIIEIRFTKETYEVGVNDNLEIKEAFSKITENGKKVYHILVVPGKYGSISKEAREMEMFESGYMKFQKSLVIVVHGLTQRLFGKLYLKLKKTKPNFPTKMFESEELALKWIYEQQQEEIASK